MFTTKILGVSDLQAEIARLQKDVGEAEDPAALAAGEPIGEKWAGLVQVYEGHLRDSITVAWTSRGAAVGTKWLPGVPRDEQPFIYSRIAEYGKDDRPAHPAARPAAKAARREALAAGAVPLQAVVKGRRPRRTTPRA